MVSTRIETRNSAFELLRIISIFMIILHHFVLHGLINNPVFPDAFVQGSSMNRFFAWLYFPGGEVGVALFFMTTGFFCIDSKKIKIKKVVMQVVFYAWLSLLLYYVLKSAVSGFTLPYSSQEIKKYVYGSLLFPVRSGSFWFATAYILLRLFLPVYNSFLEKLNKKGYLLVLAFLFVAFMQSQFFIVVLGYTKAFFFYSIGGFIKRYVHPKELVGGGDICLVVFLLSWVSYALLRYFGSNLQVSGIMKILFILFNSLFPPCVLVPVCATSILLLFSRLNIGENKFINTVSATTFGIYLLHDSNFVRSFLWCNVVKVQELYLLKAFPLAALLVCVIIFITCSLLDLIRLKLFEPYAVSFYDTLLNKIKKNLIRDKAE